MTRSIRAYMSAAMLLLLAVLVSCSQVDYGYVNTGEEGSSNPSISEISFGFDWGEMNEADVPDEMTVVMSRVVNTVHYVYSLDRDGMIIDSLTTAKEATDTVLNGDYYVLALAQTGSQFHYGIEGMEQFTDSLNLSMKDLYATIPQVNEQELIEADIVDFNPMYPFIYSADPLYLEVKKHSIYPQDEANRVVLAPQLLTRNIIFKMNVETEDDVVINRIMGIISGVPSQIQLMSGVVSRYNTSKVCFEIKDDFSNGNNYLYVGEVDVLGLFPATKPGLITGPGILQIILDASVSGGGKRRFFASINLKETIEKADLMIQTEDHLGYRSVGDAVLEVPTALVVTRDQILSSGGNGSEIWYDNEKHIDAEI